VAAIGAVISTSSGPGHCSRHGGVERLKGRANAIKLLPIYENTYSAQDSCMSLIRITGSQLHAGRALAGSSRETLAERAGVSRYSILKWEGSSHATPHIMYQHLMRTIEAIEAEGVQFLDGGVCRKRPPTPAVSTVSASEGAAA
jgi:DNA-binding transcriptional regulator YiaG